MKTLIITSKEGKGYYDLIINNWFSDCKQLLITDIDCLLSKKVSYKMTSTYCVCLPPSIDDKLDQKYKAKIVVDEVKKILNELRKKEKCKIKKDELYLLIHSSDLFANSDPRRQNGKIRIDDFPNDSHNYLNQNVDEDHMFQFSHDYNKISRVLCHMSNTDISILFETIEQIMMS